MDKKKFEEILKHIEFIDIGDLTIFNDLEVYNSITGKSLYYKTVDELLEAIVDGVSIKEELNKIEFTFIYNGGRGAGSGAMGGGFTSAGGGGGGENYGKIKYPAEFNVQGRFATQEQTVKLFTEKYGDAKIEYGISVDEQGFVHKHVEGGPTRVSINAAGRNHLIVHNHPSGGSFSKTDLLSVVQDRYSSGIVATSSKGTYTLKKGKRFDGKGFTKAVKNAKWPAKYNYDDGADWWLKKNQKVYGYTYTRN